MTPSKIKEHEPTAVNRPMTEDIVELGKQVPNPEAARERARRSGMAKGKLELQRLAANMNKVQLEQISK